MGMTMNTTISVPKGAARAVTAQAAGQVKTPKDSRQTEAFSADETGETHVNNVARPSCDNL
jgi:hypothetical protein